MALYQEYAAKNLTENGIDITNDGIKWDIEHYYTEQVLGLPVEPLERIQDFVDNYNILTKNTFRLRYFQVLALLFTEQFFADYTLTNGSELDNGENKQRMLAYWMATGSGKTLVMHLNILQYLHHFCKNDGLRLQIFLTTPLANLIKQHERELEPYVRQLNETYNNRIELIIDTTQGLLQKDKDYFKLPDGGEIRRLILVDEAHIGLTTGEAGKFKELRTRLNVRNSFLFEYSATFHNVAKEIKDEYDNSIIYRYDYARFYGDGYGKDHFFKPIATDIVDAESEGEIKDNLDECLGVMEEKLQTYEIVRNDEEYDSDLTAHRPLMAFMGHTVENPKEEGEEDEVSDIQKVLDYFAALSDVERQKYRHIFGNSIIGRLVVARNPENSSELLLSYGDGEKWGMINVGDASSFFNSIENDRIDTRDEVIVDPKLQFENLDDESCPINVLIGSRKFAEGWNSYRLSVISLINLGSSKGNLIIQIFGRGVRLRGKGGDGKRQKIDHIQDYHGLDNSKESNISRLETLTVYSLKRSYLEQFLDEVRKGGVTLKHVFKIPVNPMLFEVNGNTSVKFDDYRQKLPIFKQGNTYGSGYKRVILNGKEINYTYYEDGKKEDGSINNWRALTLDYRTDKERDVPDVSVDLRQNNERYACYLNRAKLASVIYREAEKNQLQLFSKDNGIPTIADFLPLVGEIQYRKQATDPIAWTDRLNRQIVIDVTRKLHNRINAHINKENYDYEPLNYDDLIYEYTVTKEFESQDEYDEFLEKIKEAENEIDKAKAERIHPEALMRRKLGRLLEPGHRHIYKPLILPQEDVESMYRDLKVSPDRLNIGEKKFVGDLTEYIKRNYSHNKRYEFYLMRNVQKIGIYLESDSGSYYPDFVLWVLDKEQEITRIIFIDPKGEREIIGGTRGDYKIHPKVKLAQKSEDQTLITLGKKLETEQEQRFQLDSFLLLRDSSELGKGEDVNWITENMLPYNILRLDWHDKKEEGSSSRLFNDEKSYLDLMFEKVGIQP